MSSYNENLHSTVVASLSDQEAEVQSVEAQRDASMFTLYYAQGARITASGQLDLAKEKYDKRMNVKRAAVADSNISTNALASAEVESNTVVQSVTNSAVSAANIELAANAITKLASDTGSIFSIVNAADYGSQIYDEAKYAKNLMDNTAYLAERASQHAMESSALSAKISSAAVLEKATATDTSIKSLLEVVTTEFEEISEVVDADNEILAEASEKEKKAEGELEDITGEATAVIDAYELNNEELNLNLRVYDETDTQYTVAFNSLRPAFYPDQFGNPDAKDGEEFSWDPYPVKEYYIMLVKDNKKSTFTVNTAQSDYKKETVGGGEGTTRSIPVNMPIMTAPLPLSVEFIEEVSINVLYDSDGEKLVPGEDYVVFVYAIIEDEYKKIVNNFDDYITAPSAKFKLTTKLEAATDLDVSTTIPQELTFNVRQESIIDLKDVEYRCMFLPSNRDLTTGLLTQIGLDNMEDYAEQLEEKASRHDRQYANKKLELTQLKLELKAHKQTLAKNDATAEGSSGADKTTELKGKISDCENDLKELIGKIGGHQNYPPVIDNTERFFFNLCIAQQVPAGSYIPVKSNGVEYDLSDLEAEYISGKVTVELETSTTDNFGNRLIEGKEYIPVVLSAYIGENKEAFTNAMTDYNLGVPFTYLNGNSSVNSDINSLDHAVDDIEKVIDNMKEKKKNKNKKDDKNKK